MTGTELTKEMLAPIAFGEISEIVELTIRRHIVAASPSLDDLWEADRWARETARAIVSSRQKR